MVKVIVNKNSNRFYICFNTLFLYKWGKVILSGTKTLDLSTTTINFAWFNLGRSYLRTCKRDNGGHLQRKHPSEK